MKYSLQTILSGLLCLLFACKTELTGPVINAKPFLDISGIDSTIAPGDNFFQYINQKWMNETSIPATEIGAGSFFDLQTTSEKSLLEVIQTAASISNAPHGSLEQKVGDMYTSIMDTNGIEAKGYTPLQPIFDQIQAIQKPKDILSFACAQNVIGNDVLFNFAVFADEKNVTKNIAIFMQGGLGLPDRDYYFRSDDQTVGIQVAYKAMLKKFFVLTGDDTTSAMANAMKVYELEKKIAQGHFTNVQLRDPEKNYNKMGTAQLQKMSPGLDWNALKSGLMLTTDSVNVSQPSFFTSLDKLISSEPINDWKTYFKAHTIKNNYRSLSTSFEEAGFEFFDKKLNGREAPEPRWKYAVNVIDSRMGELAGQLYVKKYFNQKSKDRMMSLIDGLQKAYAEHIKSLDWMSNETKVKALEKLGSITRKIGFPDNWKKYDSLVITKDNYFQNRINTSKYEFYRAIAKVDKEVDRSEWGMTPSTVNAGYDPTKNDITFPAGILQPPFFDPNADDAINYGGIGMVIGHELTHGFDDQGRQYDKNGNLKDWWSKEDAEKFQAITKKIVDQYAQYIPIDSLRLNGELTLGENIADIGGLAIAYDAFKMTEQGKSNEKTDGLTADQRFFMSFAQIWRLKMKDEFLRQIIHTDVHAPAEFRVVGPLTNHTPFYNTFGLTENNKMWKSPQDRIKIW